MQLICRVTLLALLLTSLQVVAEKRVFNIYHDSDYSTHGQSANAMKMGFMTALAQQQANFENIEFNFIEKDHRGNSNRSLRHMKQFLADPSMGLIQGYMSQFDKKENFYQIQIKGALSYPLISSNR